MSLLANYKLKFKAVMVNMLFWFQVRHPHCVEYKLKYKIDRYIYVCMYIRGAADK